VDHPVGGYADEDRGEAFEDLMKIRLRWRREREREREAERQKVMTHENPGPACFPSYTSHLRDTCGEQATKGACQCGGGEEDGSTDAEFGSFIPAGKVVTGKQSGFAHAEKPAL
jgi:hypothetical protein